VPTLNPKRKEIP